MKNPERRRFLKTGLAAAGGLFLFPALTACTADTPERIVKNIPFRRPTDWDPIAYNRKRGNAGAIPRYYLPEINGPDGDTAHIGKHLPYIPDLDMPVIAQGYLPIMWGDPAEGFTPHPNAKPGPSNRFQGHWYNWIRIRKAVNHYAPSVTTTFSWWPKTAPGDSGIYRFLGGHPDPKGTNAVYLAKLPPDIKPGDWVRIHAHCLTHGEYIDFLRV